MNIDNQLITADSPKRWIRMLQKQLIRENPSALLNDGIDGIYGAETAEWVTRFQERKGLYVDGIAGAETLERLRTDIVFYVGGPSGRGVELLQEDLQYFYLSTGTIDGIYGVATRQSVRDFQADNNLFVDGEAGPGTLKKMDELMTTILVQQGDTGSLVRRIQEQLNEQEGTNLSIEVDGVFGQETEDAVRQFQEANEQKVDGIAGPVTMNLLDLQAAHPLDLEAYENYLNGANYNIMVTNSTESEKANYINLLENNSVFTDNVPSTSNTLEEPNVVKVTRDNWNLFVVEGTMSNDPNVSVFATFQENELERLTFVNVDGDQYESNTKVVTYDVQGNQVEDIDSTILELTNSDLEIRVEIANFLESTSTSFARAFQDSPYDPCELQANVVAGMTCGVMFATPATALVATILCGAAIGPAVQELWCPFPQV